MNVLILVGILVSLVYIIFGLFFLKSQNKGTKKMQAISGLIKQGAKSFLKTELKVLFITVIIIGIVIAFFNYMLAIFFVIGAILSSLCGIVGMSVATSANVRVSDSNELEKGMRIAYFSGMIISIFTMLIGLLGIYTLYLLFPDKTSLLFGFGFGASLVALFMRVGGGIYTKSADVSADLVGKVEKSIPEDDPRNPAVIADLVGDNVGDVAGMSADLFESYVQSLIAAMVLIALSTATLSSEEIFIPLKIVSLGIST